MHVVETGIRKVRSVPVNAYTVRCIIVGKEIFKYPISGSEKYQNEFPTPKYLGVGTLIINME